jgi:hypothetical protein
MFCWVDSIETGNIFLCFEEAGRSILLEVSLGFGFLRRGHYLSNGAHHTAL